MSRSELIDFIVETRSSLEDINDAQKLVMVEGFNKMPYKELEEEADFCEELLMK